MGKYLMEMIRIYKNDANKDNHRYGKYKEEEFFYLTFVVGEADDIWEEPAKCTVYGSQNPWLVRKIRKLFPKGKDKDGNDWYGTNSTMTEQEAETFDPDVNIAESFRILQNAKIVYQSMDGKYLKKYTKDVLDKYNNVIYGKKRGQWVKNPNGLVKVFTHHSVLVVYKKECDGTFKPAVGWDPEQQVKDYCNRYCFPISELDDNPDDQDFQIDANDDPRQIQTS